MRQNRYIEKEKQIVLHISAIFVVKCEGTACCETNILWNLKRKM